jgi:membrane-associated phospholipid phosphatase
MTAPLPSMTQPRPVSDLRLLHERMKPHPLLKTLGITAFITAFFAGYFHLLNFPAHPVTVLPHSALDQRIPFTPWLLVAYASLWIYVAIAPVLQSTRRDLYAFGLEAAGVALIGLSIFYFWPTTLAPLTIDWENHPGFEFLKTIDAAGNACPSLHVAFSVFTAIRIHESLRQVRARSTLRVANWLWCAAIAYSTLAIKQHVIIDVLAGTLLGALGGCITWARWLLNRRHA